MFKYAFTAIVRKFNKLVVLFNENSLKSLLNKINNDFLTLKSS
jgi:hypothetical protein